MKTSWYKLCGFFQCSCSVVARTLSSVQINYRVLSRMAQHSCTTAVLEAACEWPLYWTMQVKWDDSAIKPTLSSGWASQSCQCSTVSSHQNSVKKNICCRSCWDYLLLASCLISTATLVTSNFIFLTLHSVNRAVTASTSCSHGKDPSLSTDPSPRLMRGFCFSQGVCRNKLRKGLSSSLVFHHFRKFSTDFFL